MSSIALGFTSASSAFVAAATTAAVASSCIAIASWHGSIAQTLAFLCGSASMGRFSMLFVIGYE
jgi:hypothetical protein